MGKALLWVVLLVEIERLWHYGRANVGAAVHRRFRRWAYRHGF